MAQFTVRVELHGARYDEPAYVALHAAMERVGFSRTIRDAQSGKVFQLPPAEYIIVVGHTNRAEICNMAERAAVQTGRGYSVLVTGDATCTWAHLEEL